MPLRGDPDDRPRGAAPPRAAGTAPDPTLTALDDLVAAGERMAWLLALIGEHAEDMHAGRRQGLPYRDIVYRENRPLVVEALTDTIARFEAAGTRFRQAKAAALRAEGLTLEEIGGLFGLTRQRISELLLAAGRERQDGGAPGG